MLMVHIYVRAVNPNHTVEILNETYIQAYMYNN